MKIYSMDEYNTQDKKVYSMDEYNELFPKKEVKNVPKAGLLKTTGKTILAGTNYLGQGVLKGIEGIGDTLLQIGSSKVNPYYWFNPDKLEEHQAIAKDIIKEDATKNLVNTLSGDQNFNENVLDKDSLIKESNLGGAVAKSIGQMLPSIAIGSGMGVGTKLAENVGLGVMGAQSFGGGLEQAYNQGATRKQATSYALMNSAIETATEKMFAGIGGVLGKGALDDAVKTKLTKKMSNAVAKKLTEYGLDMVGEGVEELASDLLQPLAQKLSGISKENLGKLYKDQNYLEDFVAGALSAGVMQGVRLPSDIKTAMQENAAKKATQAKLPGTRTEQSISNNIEELKQEQRETTDNKLKQELATRINGLEQELNQFKLPMASTEGMTLQESATKYNIKPETQSNVQQLMDNRNIESRWDATKFKDNSVNALWTKDANGNRQVIFNPNASLDTIIEEVAVHELTHDILSSENTTLNPVEILDYVSQLDGYNEARQSLINTYKDMYDVNSAEFNSLIDEEVVADVLGRKLGNQEFIDNLVNSKPSIAKSIYNWVVNKLNSIVNKGKVRSEKLYWQNIKNNFENAYKQEYKNNEIASTKYKVSDINTDNQGRVLSKQQQEYFKDSKVRDDNGNLEVVYHGTPNGNFNVFESQKIGTGSTLKGLKAKGFYFTDNITKAGEYSLNGNNGKGEVKSVYLDVKTPLIIDLNDLQTQNNIREYFKLNKNNKIKNHNVSDYINGQLYNDKYMLKSEQDRQNYFRNTGYDGVIVKNFDGGNEYIVFNSNQIKNIDNINPTTNEDIRYSKEAKEWNEFLDKNVKSEGTKTKLKDIKQLKKEVNLPKNTQVKQKTNIPMAKEKPVLKVNASEIANEMNSVSGKRGWIGTATQSDVLKDKVLIKDLDAKKLNYVVESNQKSVDTANNHIDTYGYKKSLEDVKSMLRSEKLPKASDVALAERLLQEAVKNGDTKAAQELLMDIAILGTDLGQATQALSIIKKLTPEGQLQMYTKIIQRAKTRGEKAFKDVEITPKMVQGVLDAYNEDGTYDQDDLNNRVEQFKQQIANQMKTTIGEKINAWRYLSMLGNPKTHIRNIVSNVAMNGTIKVKNAMARTLESVLPIENRTKTWKKATTEIQNYANKTADEMKGIITGENKYNEKTALETKKQIFKNKTLEKISDFNSKALEAEDWFFSKKAFKDTLQEYLTANGINTLEDIKNNPEVVEKAKIYAVEQAEIATFRQYSKLASQINSLEKNNKAARLFIEATIPFKKTPINVAKAGVKYSPLGLIKAISYDIYQVKQGNMEASQFIDNLSQGLTGTSLALLGYALAKAGILNGAGGDDKDNKYDSQLGDNQYSLKIGDKSYSISWLSPVAMPLLVGANAYEQLEEKEEWDMNVVSDTLAKTLDPLNEMSFMQGLTNALTSYGSGVDKIKGSLESVGQNYVGQFFPTLFSQFASTIDDKKRSTKASANSTYKFGEQTLRSVMYKLPGLRQQLEVATDIWGNEKEQADNIIQRAYESFIAPYSTTKNITSNLDKEIKRVYNKTGENGVIPGIPYAYVKYGDETYRMSANEYTKYKKTYGTAANSTLNSLINSSSYKNASDEEKAKMIDNVYDYARAKANKEYFNSINVSYENKTLDKLNTLKSEFGVSPSTYYANKSEYDYAYTNPDKYKTIKQITSYDKYTQYKDKITEIKDNTTNDKQETIKYINSLNLSIPQKAMLIKQYYKSFTQYDSEIIKYINSQNLSKEDKQTILEQLGFVIRDGRVYSK